MSWTPREFRDLVPVDPAKKYRYEVLDAAGNPTGQYQYLRYAPGTLTDTPTALNRAWMQPMEDFLGDILTPATKPLYGLPSTAVPDDVFQTIKATAYPKVGDIKTSVRTDLGTNWLLCNGASVQTSEYPDLAALLPIDTIRSSMVGSGSMGVRGFRYVNGYYFVIKQAASTNTANVYYTQDPFGTWGVWQVTTHGSGASSGMIVDIAYGNDYWVLLESYTAESSVWIHYSGTLGGTLTTMQIKSNVGSGAAQLEFANSYFVARMMSQYHLYAYASDPTGTWTYATFPDLGSLGYSYAFRVLNGQFVVPYMDGSKSQTALYTATTPTSFSKVTTIYGAGVTDIRYVDNKYFSVQSTQAGEYPVKYGSSLTTMNTSINAVLPVAFIGGYYYGVRTVDAKLVRHANLSSLYSTTQLGDFYNSWQIIGDGIVFGANFGNTVYDIKYFDTQARLLPTISASGVYTYIKALEG